MSPKIQEWLDVAVHLAESSRIAAAATVTVSTNRSSLAAGWQVGVTHRAHRECTPGIASARRSVQ
jgi:hypothetical protein